MRVFVYGTLMCGESNHRHMRGTYLGPARTGPGYALFNLGSYPALGPGDEPVLGELFDVDPADLPGLDAFEGVPELYLRGEITLADGSRAQAYWMPADRLAGAPRIVGGDWRKRA